MTLLAAVETDAGIWIGADGRHVAVSPESDAWAYDVDKLTPISDYVVWGWNADGGTAGSRLADAMKDAHFEDWDHLKDGFLSKMIEVQQGSETTKWGVLAAGYFGTDGRLEHIGGIRPDELRMDGFCGVGSCKFAMAVAWQTSLKLSNDYERCFDAALESVIDRSKHVLDEPRSVWHMTPTSRDQVRGGDLV